LKKEHLAFLIGGFAFGVVFGFGLFSTIQNQPELSPSGPAMGAQGPAGPRAPTQTGGSGAPGGGAPMMAELRALKKRIQDDPQDHGAIVRLASLYRDAKMFDQAIQLYEQALQIVPNGPDELTDMGTCLRAKQEFDRALEMFRLAQKSDPQHWESLFNEAIVVGFDLGRFDEASAALERLQTVNPQAPRLEELRHALAQARAEAEGRPGAEG